MSETFEDEAFDFDVFDVGLTEGADMAVADVGVTVMVIADAAVTFMVVRDELLSEP